MRVAIIIKPHDYSVVSTEWQHIPLADDLDAYLTAFGIETGAHVVLCRLPAVHGSRPAWTHPDRLHPRLTFGVRRRVSGCHLSPFIGAAAPDSRFSSGVSRQLCCWPESDDSRQTLYAKVKEDLQQLSDAVQQRATILRGDGSHYHRIARLLGSVP